ncbi:MAG: DUF2306 domain-containing protein [Aliishimia sp.]
MTPNKARPVNTLSRSEWTFLTFILLYSFIPAFGGLVRVVELAGGPAIIPQNPRALADPLPIVIHLLTSFLFCIFGAVQFLPSFRRNHPNVHRTNGRIIMIAGCISAASGIWMTHVYTFPQELQGSLLYLVRMVVGPLMIGCLIWAVIAIRARNIVSHGGAMIRAYAIGQGASTQTFLGIFWMIVVGSEAVGPPRESIMVLSWVLNLMIAEFLIWRLFGRKARPSGHTVTN